MQRHRIRFSPKELNLLKQFHAISKNISLMENWRCFNIDAPKIKRNRYTALHRTTAKTGFCFHFILNYVQFPAPV